MKILILTPNLHCGGAEKVLNLLSNEWAKKNDVTFCLFDTSDQFFPTKLKIIDLKSKATNNKFLKLFKFFLRVIRFQKYIKRSNPDLIISFTESANYVSILSCIIANRSERLVVSVRTNLNYFSYFTRLAVFMLYNSPFKVVSPSKGLKELLIRIGIKSSNIQVINNPVYYNLEYEKVSKINKIVKPYILAVGRLSEEKGFERLIESFSNINEDVELILIGEGPQKENLKKLAISLGLEKKVKFLGFKKNLDKWYLHARFLVLTSYFEGWPNVITEAMSFKCPVISFDCEFGPSEIIRNNYNGILIKQDDKAHLTKAMWNLIKDDILHKKLSKNAFIRAKDYKVDEIAKKWLSLKVNHNLSL